MNDSPTAAAETLRLFIACELPETWRTALVQIQAGLRLRLGDRTASMRWVRPEAFHLTLHFLGSTRQGYLATIGRGMQRAAALSTPFTLRLDGLGTFGGRHPRVVWVGLSGDIEALGHLQQRLLHELGVTEVPALFSPHITLARITLPGRGVAPPAPRLGVDMLEEALASTPVPEVAPHAVEAVSLVQSEPLPGGVRYTIRSVARLGRD